MGIIKWLAESALVMGVRDNVLSTELFSGVEKPTVTVAKMLAAEMLQNLDVFFEADRYDSYVGQGWARGYLIFPSFTVKMHRKNAHWPKESRGVYEYDLKSVEADGLLFKDEELEVFNQAFKVFIRLAEKRKKNKVEFDRQNKALDFIANKLGVKEKVDETVDAVAA